MFTDVARDLVREASCSPPLLPLASRLTQGKYTDAERYLQRALKEARAGFGMADSHFAAALNNLAELHRRALCC